MSLPILNKRRHQLGLPIRQLVKMSGVPVATVNRILADPAAVRFEHVAAVATVLGVDMAAGRRKSVRQILQDRARQKAEYIARLVQGTQGLEAAGVDPAGFERLVQVSVAALLAGKKRKLWDDD